MQLVFGLVGAVFSVGAAIFSFVTNAATLTIRTGLLLIGGLILLAKTINK